MTRFSLDQIEIVIPPEREEYNAIRRKYQAFAESTADVFSSAYSDNFKNIKGVHENCTDVAIGLLMPVVEEAIRDLAAQGIYDVNTDEFGEYFSGHFTWHDDFAVIDDKYTAIIKKTADLDASRTQRREDRGRVIGGGFGLSGAAKGIAAAGAANMLFSALHGVVNMAAKGATGLANMASESAIFSDPATKSHLTNAVYQVVFNTHFALIVALNDKLATSIIGYVSEDAAAKAARLLENIGKGRIPDAAVNGMLIEALSLNPYDEGFYTHWLKTYGDKNGELEVLESHFGVYVSTKAKKDLVATRKASLDLSTPEACGRSLVDLEAYAVSIGYRGFASEKADILALSSALDLNRRTVGGVTYPTLQEASAAQDDVARTVKGVVYATHAKADEERAKKTVGVGFGIAIFIVPMIAAFFTLRNGYSKNVRIVAFGWAALIFALVQFGSGNQNTVPTAAAKPTLESATPAAAPAAAAAAAPATTPATNLPTPGASVALMDLYGVQTQKGDKATLPSGEEVTLWYSTPVAINADHRFLVLAARTSPEKTSNADGGEIDVISYREEAGQWKADAKASGLFGVGGNGIVSPLGKGDLAKVENHALNHAWTGIFLPGSGSGQGYGTDYLDVVGVSSGTVEYFGRIEIGGENSGACDRAVKDGDGACYSWKGRVQVEPSKQGQPGEFLVKKTGTENIDSRIVPAQQSRYVWESGKGYVEAKTK
ncbi:hypothetical protein ACFDR9_003075 [Janthinobacterium sp. CG_23.3]|uniref:hypothetical protein n=1 Tax=Janthinobacterium sp. CG_23.3 TaxID=3349634 RepID=UPI0038D4FF70